MAIMKHDFTNNIFSIIQRYAVLSLMLKLKEAMCLHLRKHKSKRNVKCKSNFDINKN